MIFNLGKFNQDPTTPYIAKAGLLLHKRIASKVRKCARILEHESLRSRSTEVEDQDPMNSCLAVSNCRQRHLTRLR